MAIFRPPPTGDGESYAPYAHPGTQALMEEHTVPLMEAMFEELLLLGMDAITTLVWI